MAGVGGITVPNLEHGFAVKQRQLVDKEHLEGCLAGAMLLGLFSLPLPESPGQAAELIFSAPISADGELGRQEL